MTTAPVKKVAKKNAKKNQELNIPTPRDRPEAAELLRLLGETQREMQAIADRAANRVAKIKQAAIEVAFPHEQNFNALVDALYLYFSENRDELTDGGERRIIDLGTGTLAEKTNPPAIELASKTKTEDVLARLKELGYMQFIRGVETLNKEAMLTDAANRELAASVEGLLVTQTTEFVVKPLNFDAISSDVKGLKRRIKRKTK